MTAAFAPKTIKAPQALSKPPSLRAGMILTNQAGLRRRNPPWRLIERVVKELNAGFGNSFCCLQSPDDSYIQTLRGFNGWHLEWRVTTNSTQYVHFRAAYPGGSKKRVELEKHDFVNSGEHRDLINEDDVVDGFRAFYNGDGLPNWLAWRELVL